MILEINNLAILRSERYLLTDLNFCLQAGTLLQFQGNNGVGKTTLLKTIAGIFLPAVGEILWNETSIYAQRFEYLNNLIYLGPELSMKPLLTPFENLMQWQINHNLNLSHEQIHLALAQVQLHEVKNKWLSHLSSGQQRRVLLAKLLLKPAKLWLLDEPYNALDKTGCAWLDQQLLQHQQQGGMAIVISHNPLQLSAVQTLQLGAE